MADRFRCGSLRQLIDEGLGLPHVERVEALGEPVMDWGEQIARLLGLAPIAPHSSHAHRRA